VSQVRAVLLDLYDTLAWTEWPTMRAELEDRFGLGEAELLRAFTATREARSTGAFGSAEGDLAAILDAAGIPLPQLTEEIGESGAGHLSQRFGRFPVSRLGLGPLVQEDTSGLYGIFPDAWRELAGVSIHGILSHGFLRRYAWTLDFDRMAMTFASAAAD